MATPGAGACEFGPLTLPQSAKADWGFFFLRRSPSAQPKADPESASQDIPQLGGWGSSLTPLRVQPEREEGSFGSRESHTMTLAPVHSGRGIVLTPTSDSAWGVGAGYTPRGAVADRAREICFGHRQSGLFYTHTATLADLVAVGAEDPAADIPNAGWLKTPNGRRS